MDVQTSATLSTPPYSQNDSTREAVQSACRRFANAGKYLTGTLNYLFCKPLETRTTTLSERENICTTLNKPVTNRMSATLVSGLFVGGIATALYALGCANLGSTIPYLTTDHRSLLLSTVTPLVAIYFQGRVGQQAGDAADRLLAHREGLTADHEQSFFKKHKWALVMTGVGILSTAGLMFAAGSAAITGLGLAHRGVALATLANTVTQGALAFVSTHLEGRAQKL